MNKLNTKGFSPIEGLLGLVIIGVIGGAGFYVVNARKNISKNLTATNSIQPPKNTAKKDTKPEVKETTRKTYKNDTYGYSFTYPTSWKTSNAINEGDTPGSNRASITVESPDLASSSEGAGFHLTKGARMYVAVDMTSATSPDQVIDNSKFTKSFAKDRQPKRVDGELAVSYTIAYEGPPTLNTVAVKNGKVFWPTPRFNAHERRRPPDYTQTSL